MNSPAWVVGRPVSLRERAVERFFQACAATSVLIVLLLLGTLLSGIAHSGADLWLQAPPLWPLLMGSLLFAAIACAVALPLGMLAAVYLCELASPTRRRVARTQLWLISSIPAVVYGCLALTVVSPLLQQGVPGLDARGALGPGLVMGIMLVPGVTFLLERAISTVPDSLREAAVVLGISPLATLIRVVLPAARTSIAAVLLLTLTRALGETMIVSLAAGLHPALTLDPRAPMQSLTSYMVHTSLNTDGLTGGVFVAGGVLFAFIMVLNQLGQRLIVAGEGGA